MINLLFNIISNSNLNSVCFKDCKDEKGVVEEVIYGNERGLDGRIPDCKLAMHVNCFNEIWKSLIYDIGSRHNGISNRLDRLKNSCHHSFWDLCVHIDGAWRKLKKYCDRKDIGTYPDGCIICLKSFSVGCVSLLKKDNNCMMCSICYDLFSS